MHADSPSRTRGRLAISIGALCTTLLTVPATAPAALAQGTQFPPAIEMRVPKPPTLAAGDGQVFLVYELHITNFSAAPVTLRAIDVLRADEDRSSLQTLRDSALIRTLTRPGLSPAPPFAERGQIGGGLRAVAFLWVPVDRSAPPSHLRHRLTLATGTGDSATVRLLEGATVPVSTAPVVIGPPLRGGDWYAANGPDSTTGHRRGLFVAGAPMIAQRFAIDYLVLDDDGRSYTGERLSNDSYHAQGAEIIAVADGIVVDTRDGIPENVPGGRAVPITLETVAGNYVILDIGDGRFAFYAHLQPGSLRVRTGDTVRRGQLLGLVGNSGNSTEPHLHFHVSDGPSALAAEGIPYVIDEFTLVGRCRRILAECARSAPQTRRLEIPMGNTIIRFPR